MRGQFLSPFFVLSKPDGGSRFVLNLNALNKFLDPAHFKMEDVRTACALIQNGDFFAKIDLEKAYYAVAIHPEFRKFLRFRHQGTLFEFRCLPFGLSLAPLIFTKLLRPVFGRLRSEGFTSVTFLDDFLCIASSEDRCRSNVLATVDLLQSLGFRLNWHKSSLQPVQQIVFLGYTLNSSTMEVGLPPGTIQEVVRRIQDFRTRGGGSIRQLASLIGLLNFCCFAVPYGRLHLKPLEIARFRALCLSDQDFDAFWHLSSEVDADLHWWASHVPTGRSPIRREPFVREIFPDASSSGWGAHCRGQSVSGAWQGEEGTFHINFLELRAARRALQAFAGDCQGVNILLRVDNTTALTYINKMGGIQSPLLQAEDRRLWAWCEDRNLWVFASFIRSADNTEADLASRLHNPDTEWELSESAFRVVTSRLGTPQIDLFATPGNAKCRRFFSWFPAAGAEAVDALTQDWGRLPLFWAFPPFALILKTLQRVRDDPAEGIILVPNWPHQAWYPLYRELVKPPIVFLRPSANLLLSACRTKRHPLYRTLGLQAAMISGRRSQD